MNKNFDRAIDFVLRHEGGYVNDPRDPGGETNFGISRRAYPTLDIKNLTKEQATGIYRKDYWDKVGGDILPWPWDLILFDTAVNQGVAWAIRFFVPSMQWWDYLFIRIKFYADLRKPEFLRGWINRVFRLYEEIKKGA